MKEVKPAIIGNPIIKPVEMTVKVFTMISAISVTTKIIRLPPRTICIGFKFLKFR